MVGLVGFGRRGLKETIKIRNVQPFVLKFKYITFFKKNKRKEEKRKRKKVDKERKRKKKKRKEKKVFSKKVFHNMCFLKKIASKKDIYL